MNAILTILMARTADAGNCNVVAPAVVASCNNICTVTAVPSSSLTIDCDTTINGDGSPATATAVIKLSVPEFQVWGVDSTNTAFCCVIGADPWPSVDYTETLRLSGGSSTDTLSFTFAGGGGAPPRDLVSPRNDVWLNAYIYGRAEADTLIGSTGGINLYEEWLYGQTGNDAIDAKGGSLNHILGGADDDTLTGAVTGWNTIEGDDGDDVVFGGDYLNYIDGGDGNDCLSGGADYDQIWGGNGDDTLNGGDGDDELYGQIGDDDLDGGAGSDANSCAVGTNTSVYDVDDSVFCPNTSATSPLACP